MAWAKTYKAIFGRRLDDEDVSEWERLLDAAFRKGADRSWEDEIVPALEAIGEAQRSVGRNKHPPDFSEVKTAIIRARYQKRGDNEPPKDQQPGDHDCPFCQDSGGMTWYPEIKPPYPTTLTSYIEKVRAEQIYCSCAKGRALATENHYRGYDSLTMRQVQEEARAQYRAKMGKK